MKKLRSIRCAFCKKRYSIGKKGVKNLNEHVAQEHSFAYKYKIKSMYENLVEELNEKLT